jgi:hypothetical protein
MSDREWHFYLDDIPSLIIELQKIVTDLKKQNK